LKKKELLDMSLGDRMKYYESQYEQEIKPEQHLCVRIDGHKFSKFTNGFKKPFDSILSKAMELTTMDLLEEFSAYTAYTQSDEITLIIPSLKDNTVDNRKSTKHKLHKTIRADWKHEYSGRVQKMSSLIAGFTTMKFNKHLNDEANRYYDSNITTYTEEIDREYITNIFAKKLGNAWFDCRIYGVDSDEEAFNSVLWRIRDAEKNSRSMFAQAYCSHKELQNMTGLEQVQFCKEKTGEDWNLVDDRYKYGILIKKEYFLKPIEGGNMDYSQGEFVQRSRVISWAQHMTFSDENVKLIMAKVK